MFLFSSFWETKVQSQAANLRTKSPNEYDKYNFTLKCYSLIIYNTEGRAFPSLVELMKMILNMFFVPHLMQVKVDAVSKRHF